MFASLLVVLFGSKSLLASVVLSVVVVTGTTAAVIVVSTDPASARVAYPADPLLEVDAPTLGARTANAVEVTGFAVDRNSPDGPGIDKVSLYLNGLDAGNKLGDAVYGADRPDVAAFLNEPIYLKSGWTYTWSAGQLEGNHTLFVVARAKGGRVSVVSREVNDPLVRFDTPTPGATLRHGTLVEVAGWALDRSDTAGDGITSVTLYLDSKTSTPLGTATLGQASSSLADQYGDRFGTSGWTFTWDLDDTTTVGDHTLYAVATSSVSGHETTATRAIVVKPAEDDADDPGCSDWAHLRNAAWHEAHAMWKSARDEIRSLASAGGKKGGKGPVQLALGSGRTMIDAGVKSVHSEIQKYAHAHKCEAGPAAKAAYDKILSEYKADLEGVIAERKVAVQLALLAEAAEDQDDEKGKGNGKHKDKANGRNN